MADFSNPRTLALLGAAAGFLDPRGGMMGGFQGAMQGYQSGMMAQDRQFQQQMIANKMRRQIDMEQALRDATTKYSNDPAGLSKALMSTPYTELINLGVKIRPEVKQFLESVDESGNRVYKPGFKSGEVGAPAANIPTKAEFINNGGSTIAIDPYNMNVKGQMQRTMSPDSAAQLVQSANQFDRTHSLAQQNADLARARMLLDYNPQYQAQKAGEIAASKARALNKVQATADLPKVIQQGEQTISLVDDLLKHPGFKVSVGKTAPIGSAMSFVPGTDAASFDIALKQLKGKQFLEAFESLKGGGQITQIEGEKATQAMSRMEKANTEQEFIKASHEFQDIIRTGINRAKSKAGMQPTQQAPVIDGFKIERLD